MDDFVALGASLRQAREARDLSREELERLTRIRPKYVEAIENGDFESVGAPIQLRGFLRNYAHAVGLDGESVVAHYEQILASGSKGRRKKKDSQDSSPPLLDLSAPPPNYQPPPTVTGRTTQPLTPVGSSSSASKTGRYLRIVLVISGAAALTAAVVGGILLTINSITDNQARATAPLPLIEISNTASNDLTGIGGDSTLEPTRPGIEIAPPVQSTPSFEGANQLFIALTATERLYLIVEVDGNPVFRGILPPGTGTQYSANDRIRVRTSNARGLEIRINNQDFSMGNERITAEEIFTLEGLISPTQEPTNPPTPTTTASATFTLGPSVTATLTNTPTDAAQSSASSNNTESQASQSATFFFTPSTLTVPTLLPSPIQGQPTSTITPLPSPVQATFTPTLTITPTPTLTLSPTNTATPSYTPTIILTSTPFLPPRATRTPLPQK